MLPEELLTLTLKSHFKGGFLLHSEQGQRLRFTIYSLMVSGELLWYTKPAQIQKYNEQNIKQLLRDLQTGMDWGFAPDGFMF